MPKKGTGVITIGSKSYSFKIGDNSLNFGTIPKTGHMSLIAYPVDMNTDDTDITGDWFEKFDNAPDSYDIVDDSITFDFDYTIITGAESSEFHINYFAKDKGETLLLGGSYNS